jgi:hypothetical protein
MVPLSLWFIPLEHQWCVYCFVVFVVVVVVVVLFVWFFVSEASMFRLMLLYFHFPINHL